MGPITSINLIGHTDTLGEAEANLLLSRQRADTVADEMIRLGVPRAIVGIAAKGETRPRVDTGDNIREPLNNRVAIFEWYDGDTPTSDFAFDR